MRRGFGSLAVVVAALAAPAAAQDPADARFWPLRDINFPVPVDQLLAANPKPVKLRFHVAPNRGEWRQVAERAVDDLDVIDREKNRKGFKYTSPADGEYDFALQLVFADGGTQPRTGELSAQHRVVFDTRPPSVRVATVGTSGIEWAVEDENLKPEGVTVEVRWQGESTWTPVTPRAFRARDSYTWNGLNPRSPLEVRVVGFDRANLSAASRVITLPTTGGGTGLGADPVGRPGFGNANDFSPPEKSYSSSKTLTINSKLTKVTRSGVRAAHLWMNDKTGWKKVKSVDALTITATTPDPAVPIEYTVAKDGLYGFIVIPENGAGNKDADPRPDAPAQFLIEVDTETPYIKILAARVVGAGVRGPKVEIEWEARDNNLWPEPITLEYAENRAAADWKPIHPDRPRIANTGRFVWEVEDKNLWKLSIRARALDMAALEGQHVFEKEVVIDLDVPKATIDRVKPSGGSPTPHQAERPPEPQASRTPDPMPLVSSPPTPPAPVGTPTSRPANPPEGAPIPSPAVPESKPGDAPVGIPKLPEPPKKDPK